MGKPEKHGFHPVFWERVAIALLTVLMGLVFKWVDTVSDTLQNIVAKHALHEQALIHRGAAARTTVWVMEENMRNTHHELEVNRAILNRIDKNTGGPGEAPNVRELLRPPNEMREES